MDWVSIWRDFNFVLSGFALFLLIRRYVQFRHDWTFQEREVLRGFIVLLAGSFVGSLWAVLAGFGFNLGMAFVTVATIHAIQATLRAPDRYAHEHSR